MRIHFKKTETGSFPVSLSDLKDYLRFKSDSEDTLINEIGEAAVRYIETLLQRSYVARTIVATYYDLEEDDLEEREVSLYWSPVDEIQSVKLIPKGGEDPIVLVLNESYYLEGGEKPLLSWDRFFITSGRYSLEVTYTTKPDDFNLVRQAYYKIVSDLWSQRSASIIGTITQETELSVNKLLRKLRQDFYF